MFRGVVLNLGLAVIPVVLAYAWTHLARGKGGKNPVTLVIAVPLAVAWLLFVPNTCYLLTEWRHLLFDPYWESILDRAHVDRIALLRTAKWALLFLGYSGTGVLLFTLSIRPVERWVRSLGKPFYLFAPPLFLLIALGVYLGLIVRLNSWDIVGRPQEVWSASVHALTHQTLLVSIIVFAALLWGLYEAVDIWVDGLAQRLPWGKKSSSGPSRPAKK